MGRAIIFPPRPRRGACRALMTVTEAWFVASPTLTFFSTGRTELKVAVCKNHTDSDEDVGAKMVTRLATAAENCQARYGLSFRHTHTHTQVITRSQLCHTRPDRTAFVGRARSFAGRGRRLRRACGECVGGEKRSYWLAWSSRRACRVVAAAVTARGARVCTGRTRARIKAMKHSCMHLRAISYGRAQSRRPLLTMMRTALCLASRVCQGARANLQFAPAGARNLSTKSCATARRPWPPPRPNPRPRFPRRLSALAE